jgi:hypothetical protein
MDRRGRLLFQAKGELDARQPAMESARRKRFSSRSLALLASAALIGIVPACEGGGGGGITIQANDSTPPGLTLEVAVAGGTEEASVSDGGSDQSLTLPNKTGTLNLAATASDQESGVQALQIWVSTTTTRCMATGTCQQTGPGLLGSPMFESSQPVKNPGDTTAASSILADVLKLPDIIQGSAPPGGSLHVQIDIWATAVNHRGVKSQTASVTARWDE